MVALALLAISLPWAVRVQAMPADAHITETWYSYKQDLTYNFQAEVGTGTIYKSSPVQARDLLQVRLPTDPPTYSRVLVAKLTDRITLTLPYHFVAEQDADVQVTYSIDGTLTVPNLWQRPYPFVPKTVVNLHGKEVQLYGLKVEIPIKDLMAELEKVTQETKINQEQAEIRVRPVFQVTVGGLREPVAASLAPEILISLRGANYAIEVDEPRTFHDEKSFSEHKILPATISLFGYPVQVNLLREVGTTLAVIFGAVTAAVLAIAWARQRVRAGYDIKKLGPYLVSAAHFEISATAAIVELQSLKELLQLQVQMERPVVQVGRTYYLADLSTCYCYTEPEPVSDPEPQPPAGEETTPPTE